MPLTTTATATSLGIAVVGSTLPHPSRFFKLRKQYEIVPIDSSLYETSVVRSLARGLRCNDPDYFVAMLRILVTASAGPNRELASTESLLDLLVSIVQKHCHLRNVYKRINHMKVCHGSEQDYACCFISSALMFLMKKDKNT